LDKRYDNPSIERKKESTNKKLSSNLYGRSDGSGHLYPLNRKKGTSDAGNWGQRLIKIMKKRDGAQYRSLYQVGNSFFFKL